MSEYTIDYRTEAIHILKIGLFPILLFIALSGYNFITAEQVTNEYKIQSISYSDEFDTYTVAYFDGLYMNYMSLDKSDYGDISGDVIRITYTHYKLSGTVISGVDVI